MTTALAVAQTTVARARDPYYRGGMSYCQQFAGNFWEAFFGRGTPNSYASAAAAYRASSIASMDPLSAPPGAYHYFEYGTLGHVGVALGSGLMASGTGRSAGALMNLGKNVYVHAVSTYGLRYLGWSYTNGARERITGLTDHNAPVMTGRKRQVGPGGAKRRSAPSTTLGTAAANTSFAPGAIVEWDGFVRSTLSGGQPNGDNIWLVKDGLYTSWTAMVPMTEAQGPLKNIPDLGTIAPPKPIIFHDITVKYLNETNDVKVIQVESGKLLAAPTAPARDAFDFQGWAVDGVLYDFATPVAKSFTLEALWSAKPVPVDPEPEPTPDPVDPDTGEPTNPPDPGTVPPVKPGTGAPSGSVPWGVIVGGIVTAVFAIIAGLFGIGGGS